MSSPYGHVAEDKLWGIYHGSYGALAGHIYHLPIVLTAGQHRSPCLEELGTKWRVAIRCFDGHGAKYK